MFWLLATLFIWADILVIFFTDSFELYAWQIVQFQVFCIASCGWIAANKPSKRKTSGMFVICLFTLLVLATDFFSECIPDHIRYIESSFFFALLVFVFGRPYEFPSEQLTKNTVCFAFYKQNGGSILMHIFGLFGLPVTSMSVICGNLWLKLERNEELLQLTELVDIEKSKYIIVDTGIEITPKIIKILKQLRFEPARTKGSLFLRLRCIASIKLLLNELGTYYMPRNVFEQIPAVYFYKMMDTEKRKSHAAGRKSTGI